MANQNQITLVAALLDDHNLNFFKGIKSFPPMWRELGYFLPIGIIVWPTRPPSAYSVPKMIGRKLDNVWKQYFYFPRTGCLFVVRKEKEKLLTIITSTTNFSRKALHQSE